MRVRTTWKNEEIVKRASLSKQADPYLMNQDHVSKQPSADKYVTGDPSTFAEDPNTEDRWKEEMGKRNEIGMPDFRKDTFNHPEKTAALNEALLIKKADLATSVARMMLPKTASEQAVEDQAFNLMFLPDNALLDTHARLANDEQEQGGEQEHAITDQEQAKQANEEQSQAQEQAPAQQTEQKQAGKVPPQFMEHMKEKKEEGEDEQAKQARLLQAAIALGDMNVIKTVVASQVASQVKAALALVKKAEDQAQEQQSQAQEQAPAQQAPQTEQKQATAPVAAPAPAADLQTLIAAEVAKAVSASLRKANGQPQQDQMQQQAQGQMAPEQDVAAMDDMLLDDMMGGPAPVDSDMGIQLDPMEMGVDDASFGPEDEMLTQLFTANQEAQDAQSVQEQQAPAQQKQAHTARTASTRTVGTRPSGGVSKIGGAASGSPAGGEVNNLSSLWTSAPDVRDAFGLPKS